MRIIFAGTPDFAAHHLEELITNGIKIDTVYTQPDRPSGRGHKLTPSAVKTVALKYNIPVRQPETLKNNTDELYFIKKSCVDLIIVVAYGLIIPQSILDLPSIGCINVHGSLLPKWRGAAPIQRSIWNGDKTTGITIMKMVQKLDAGSIIVSKEIPIEPHDTSLSLYSKLEKIGSSLLLNLLPNINEKLLNASEQAEDQVTYAAKITKDEAKIDFSRPAEEIERHIRAFNPWPISYIEINNIKIKVFEAQIIECQKSLCSGEIISVTSDGVDIATSKNILRIKTLQMPNKKVMSFKDFYNSKQNTFTIGTIIK